MAMPSGLSAFPFFRCLMALFTWSALSDLQRCVSGFYVGNPFYNCYIPKEYIRLRDSSHSFYSETKKREDLSPCMHLL